ncbi:hypothetical protein Bhyg_06507 [Pseudolycoriella hygida]|uniref:Uncharacterized protein n=1 Tax=Pseudolycoriella hygida TaxID=35572 RepID=A0A9Q0N215_9DIPT|nr:hypothetical protein Bhyg_06507 [Pseudolycoriella hygida]
MMGVSVAVRPGGGGGRDGRKDDQVLSICTEFKPKKLFELVYENCFCCVSTVSTRSYGTAQFHEFVMSRTLSNGPDAPAINSSSLIALPPISTIDGEYCGKELEKKLLELFIAAVAIGF